MKKALIILLILSAAGFVVWKLLDQREFLYAGTIEATEVDVSSRLASVIADFPAREGADAVAGQVLARLDCDDLRLASDLAKKDYERADRLLKSGTLSPESFDKLRWKKDDSSVRLDWCTVKSPIKGRVLTVYHEKGEWVTPGTKLLTLADLSEVWAYFYLEQGMMAKLSVGMGVEGVLPELSMKKYEGKVTRINDEAEFTPKNVQTREERTRLVYGVKVTFPNPEGTLKSGMTIEIRMPKL